MRVGIIALLHESNTFVTPPTTIRNFEENLLVRGEAVRTAMEGTHHEVGGFFEGLAAAGAVAVPIFAARAIPSGTITTETFTELWRRLREALEDAPAFDGLLIAPHGATVSEPFPDADGQWMRSVRQMVGHARPIIGTLDAHANLSPQMVEATDALIAYRTNPHLDQRERGREAADLMVRTLRGEISPVQAAAFPPLVINIERQLTAEPHLVPVYQHAAEIRERPGILSASLLLGFPYADVPEMGAACVVVADGDRDLARRAADELGQDLWDRRADFVGKFISVPEAIARAKELSEPVCLLDMGDNVGGGSPADGTFLAEALLSSGMKSLACLYDPEVVERCRNEAVGSVVEVAIGAKTDRLHGVPLRGTFAVRGHSDGRFREAQARHGGIREYDQGATVVLEHGGGLTLIVNSRRTPPFSLGQIRSCGLEPRDFHALAAKGVNAPVAAYQEVCPHFIRVNTPGCTTADVHQLTFQHRRRPLYPFEGGDEGLGTRD